MKNFISKVVEYKCDIFFLGFMPIIIFFVLLSTLEPKDSKAIIPSIALYVQIYIIIRMNRIKR